MILAGPRNFMTTPRIRPDVCDITESQLLFATPQCSVIKLRALGFQKRSVGIKMQHSHTEYMQDLNYWDKQETCTTCHIVCHCILDEAGMPGWFRQGCDYHAAVMTPLISPPVSARPTHVPLIFFARDLQHPEGSEIFVRLVFYRRELQHPQLWSWSDPVSGESSNSLWTNWPFSECLPKASSCLFSAVRPSIRACEILKTSNLGL